jgi:formate dehydrogenase maturation protein FdhE
MSERPDRPARSSRPESREVVELRLLRESQPELAPAVDMQIDLVEVQRRVQSRVPLPRIHADPAWLAGQQAAGRPAVRFSDIPLDWTEFRLSLRKTADILHRHEALDRDQHQRILSIARSGNELQPFVTRWYEMTSGVSGSNESESADASADLNQVLALAMRPFLARSAEALEQQGDFSAWAHGHCPFCGWEPDFAVITTSGGRRLICGRCSAQWTFGAYACPFCANDDRARITSFATRDGRYRVYACDECKRYLKAYDSRTAPRPVLVAVDTIATLPLDAAAQQRGYVG